MLCKCSGKYIDIYFILKITYLLVYQGTCLNHPSHTPSDSIRSFIREMRVGLVVLVEGLSLTLTALKASCKLSLINSVSVALAQKGYCISKYFIYIDRNNRKCRASFLNLYNGSL